MPQVAQTAVSPLSGVARRLLGGPPSDDPALPLSARTKIVRFTFRMSVTFVVVLLVAVSAVLLLQHELVKIDQEIIPAMSLNIAVRDDMGASRTALQRDVLVSDPAAAERFRDAQQRIAASWASLESLVADDPELEQAIAQERQQETAWSQEHAAPIITEHADGRSVPSAAQVAAESAFERFRVANSDVGTILRDRHQALVSHSIITLWIALAVAILVIIAGMVWTIQPALGALRWIGPPLEDLHATVRRLQRGDLSARADPSRGVVEIRAVSAAVNRLAAAHQRELERSAEEIRLAEAVRRIGSIVSATFDLEEIIAGCSAPVISNFAAAGVWIRAFETAAAEIEPDDYGSVYPRRSSPQRLVTLVRRAAELAWRRRSYFVIRRNGLNDAEYFSDDDAQEVFTIPDVAGADSMLVIPLGGGGTCVGYIGLRRLPDQPDWTPMEVAALQRVGGDIGQAILHSRLYEQERRLVAQLQELDAAKTDFVSMVSHELRTPLASIIGHLEIVQGGDAGPIDEETLPFLSAIDRNATRLSTLIEDLLLLSRIEQRAAHGMRTQVNLSETASSVVAMYAETAARKNITVALDAVEHAPVVGDPSELEHVITNLLGNAIKYSPPDTTVVMTLRVVMPSGRATGSGPRLPPELILSVRDQGIGIAPEDQAKIFERFYRASSSATLQVPGTGLGLAITRLVVLRHGGTVAVESALGRGSTFVVTLPVELQALAKSAVSV